MPSGILCYLKVPDCAGILQDAMLKAGSWCGGMYDHRMDQQEYLPPQTGRRILVTGANSGIGYEAALVANYSGVLAIDCSRHSAIHEGSSRITGKPEATESLPVCRQFAN